jgi:SnoaL-like protein
MSKHVSISPNEAADRLAIRELVEAYAHCADRRDAKGQMALFTADTHFVVYMNARMQSLRWNCIPARRLLPSLPS